MLRSTFATIALCLIAACASDDATQIATQTPAPEAFTGAWRSVTPSLEFIRLSVVSKSSRQGVFGARLTFSGVFWEGSGRIQGDSLVANMTLLGAAGGVSRVVVAHVHDAHTLRVQMRAATSDAAPLELSLVREN